MVSGTRVQRINGKADRKGQPRQRRAVDIRRPGVQQDDGEHRLLCRVFKPAGKLHHRARVKLGRCGCRRRLARRRRGADPGQPVDGDALDRIGQPRGRLQTRRRLDGRRDGRRRFRFRFGQVFHLWRGVGDLGLGVAGAIAKPLQQGLLLGGQRRQRRQVGLGQRCFGPGCVRQSRQCRQVGSVAQRLSRHLCAVGCNVGVHRCGRGHIVGHHDRGRRNLGRNRGRLGLGLIQRHRGRGLCCDGRRRRGGCRLIRRGGGQRGQWRCVCTGCGRGAFRHGAGAGATSGDGHRFGNHLWHRFARCLTTAASGTASAISATSASDGGGSDTSETSDKPTAPTAPPRTIPDKNPRTTSASVSTR